MEVEDSDRLRWCKMVRPRGVDGMGGGVRDNGASEGFLPRGLLSVFISLGG